jgi:hypothetical protein
MNMPVDAYVIRSQRNKHRRPALAIPFVTNQHVNNKDGLDECGDEFNYETQSKLRLVKPQHYLGYISTG